MIIPTVFGVDSSQPCPQVTTAPVKLRLHVSSSAKETHLPHATTHASTPTMHHSTSIKAFPAGAPALPCVPRRFRARVARTSTLSILSVIIYKKGGAQKCQNIQQSVKFYSDKLYYAWMKSNAYCNGWTGYNWVDHLVGCTGWLVVVHRN